MRQSHPSTLPSPCTCSTDASSTNKVHTKAPISLPGASLRQDAPCAPGTVPRRAPTSACMQSQGANLITSSHLAHAHGPPSATTALLQAYSHNSRRLAQRLPAMAACQPCPAMHLHAGALVLHSHTTQTSASKPKSHRPQQSSLASPLLHQTCPAHKRQRDDCATVGATRA
jgi:hypothetical protein